MVTCLPLSAFAAVLGLIFDKKKWLAGVTGGVSAVPILFAVYMFLTR